MQTNEEGTISEEHPTAVRSEMDFEWDEIKRAANRSKHRVDLLDAAGIFWGPVLTVNDERLDYGEPRFRSVGFAGDQCYVVVWTQRGEACRLISAWKGGRREREEYETRVPR